MANKKNLDELANLENSAKGISHENHISPLNSENTTENTDDFKDEVKDTEESFKSVGIIDGYKILAKTEIPFNGRLYPNSWQFAYRCPTSKEVANFSTINEKDQPAIIGAIEELIKACYVIVDTNTGNQVSSAEINDGERLFFFLKLREYYLHDKPIEYMVMSQTFQEPVTVQLLANSLIYNTLTEKLLESFDGRMFTIHHKNLEEPIKFLIPTLDISARIFRYILKTYRDSQKEDSDNMKDSEAFNKQFLLVAPFLYEKGNETVESLKQKFKKITADGDLLNAYITIINKINLTNLEKINFIHREAEEETQIKFPGGWKNMFIDTEDFEGLFG